LHKLIYQLDQPHFEHLQQEHDALTMALCVAPNAILDLLLIEEGELGCELDMLVAPPHMWYAGQHFYALLW
jgi:hypothetical protein